MGYQQASGFQLKKLENGGYSFPKALKKNPKCSIKFVTKTTYSKLLNLFNPRSLITKLSVLTIEGNKSIEHSRLNIRC